MSQKLDFFGPSVSRCKNRPVLKPAKFVNTSRCILTRNPTRYVHTSDTSSQWAQPRTCFHVARNLSHQVTTAPKPYPDPACSTKDGRSPTPTPFNRTQTMTHGPVYILSPPSSDCGDNYPASKGEPSRRKSKRSPLHVTSCPTRPPRAPRPDLKPHPFDPSNPTVRIRPAPPPCPPRAYKYAPPRSRRSARHSRTTLVATLRSSSGSGARISTSGSVASRRAKKEKRKKDSKQQRGDDSTREARGSSRKKKENKKRIRRGYRAASARYQIRSSPAQIQLAGAATPARATACRIPS